MLSQELREKLSTMEGGKEYLEEYEAVVKESIDRKTKIRDLTKTIEESGNSVKTMAEQLKDAGIDPAKSVKDQIESMKESVKSQASQGMTPSKEYEALAKKHEREMDKLRGEWESEKKAREEAAQAIKIEKAKSAFSPILSEHFGKTAQLLLEKDIREGRITVNDKGEPGVFHDDEFISLSENEGSDAINILRNIHKDFAVSKQVGGAADTSARGGRSDGIKIISLPDFENLDQTAKTSLIADVKAGKAKIE